MLKVDTILCLIAIFLALLLFVSTPVEAVNKYNFHPECGESPTHKYKELAKAIGKLNIRLYFRDKNI
jgi:hypothetical protein